MSHDAVGAQYARGPRVGAMGGARVVVLAGALIGGLGSGVSAQQSSRADMLLRP